MIYVCIAKVLKKDMDTVNITQWLLIEKDGIFSLWGFSLTDLLP